MASSRRERTGATSISVIVLGQIRWPVGGIGGLYGRMQGPTTQQQPGVALKEDRLLRPEQAAWYLNVKTSWVYEAVRAVFCRAGG